jgi:hypothetical protein
MKRAINYIQVIFIAIVFIFTANHAMAKSALEETNELKSGLLQQMTLVTGLHQTILNDIKMVPTLPEGFTLGDLKPDALVKGLTECFSAPLEKVEGFKPKAIKFTSEISLDQRENWKELNEVKEYSTDAVSSVKPCMSDGVKQFNEYVNTLNDTQKKLLSDKLNQVNALRVHLQQTMPTGLTALTKAATETQAKVEGFIKKQEAELVAISKNPLAKSSAKQKAQEELDKLKAEKDGIVNLSQTILNDTKDMPSDLATVGKDFPEKLKTMFTTK